MAETLDDLLAKRDEAWAKVCRVNSTRWDLTRFEQADAVYRSACNRLGVPYVNIS